MAQVWKKSENYIARVVPKSQVGVFFRKDIILSSNEKAVMIKNGDVQETIDEGKLRVGGFLKSGNIRKDVDVALIDISPKDLQWTQPELWTSDNQKVGCSGLLRFRIQEPKRFIQMLYAYTKPDQKGEKILSIQDIYDRLESEAITLVLEPEIRRVSVDILYGSKDLRLNIENELEMRLKSTLSMWGLEMLKYTVQWDLGSYGKVMQATNDFQTREELAELNTLAVEGNVEHCCREKLKTKLSLYEQRLITRQNELIRVQRQSREQAKEALANGNEREFRVASRRCSLVEGQINTINSMVEMAQSMTDASKMKIHDAIMRRSMDVAMSETELSEMQDSLRCKLLSMQNANNELSIQDSLRSELLAELLSEKTVKNELSKKKECINFTLTASSIMAPGNDYEISVWAHLYEQQQEMLECAEDLHNTADICKRSKRSVPVERNTLITVFLEIPAFNVDNPIDTIYWDGKVANATFMVNVPDSTSFGDYKGKLLFLVEGLQIARLDFRLTVGIEDETVSLIPANQTNVNLAFASYASIDRKSVLTSIRGMQKINPSIDVFIDVVSLRSGEDWYKRIKEEIENRDIFYLFWSEAASHSEWVEREWRIALESKGIQFISPVPLVSPDKVKPPKELAKLHFNDWILAYINEN